MYQSNKKIMKQILNNIALMILQIILAHSAIAQNKTIFTYDAKGNMLTATYSGSNKCNNTLPSEITASKAETTGSLQLKVTPVPASDLITINYTIPKVGVCDMEVYNMLGERIAVVKSGMLQAGSFTELFAISTIADGTYLIVLRTKEGQVNEKFLKE